MAARHDLATDPTLLAELLTARRGTAFFNLKLDELSDSEMHGDSLLPGWTRRHVVAHVGYNARAIARLMKWAGTGVETPMYESGEARNEEIAFGATLSPVELRNLYDQSDRDLNLKWRELPDENWSNLVKNSQGRVIPASDTVWMRTREVWVHSVDLNNGASFEDIPVDVLERMLVDVTDVWKSRGDDAGLLLTVSSAQKLALGDLGAANPEIVSGSLAGVTAWACGRGAAGVTSSTRENSVAPRWF